jgi:hypothetical protein
MLKVLSHSVSCNSLDTFFGSVWLGLQHLVEGLLDLAMYLVGRSLGAVSKYPLAVGYVE